MIKVFVDLLNAFGFALFDKISQIVLCIFVPWINWNSASVRTLTLSQNHRLSNIAGRLLIYVYVGRPSAQPRAIRTGFHFACIQLNRFALAMWKWTCRILRLWLLAVQIELILLYLLGPRLDALSAPLLEV